MIHWNVYGEIEVMPSKPNDRFPILIFFPEIIGVAVLVLLSPLWSVRLINQGYIVYGCLILIIVITGTLGFVWCMIKRWRFIAFLVMGAIVLAFMLILSRLPASVRTFGNPVQFSKP
jgi:hypothetical protein